ncbi:hypothetical protein K5D56_11835 [Pseudomonas cichorii]|nr:hypothetical protein [Pseudomonas cichorii]
MNEKIPFPYDNESRVVMRSFMRDAQEKVEALRETYVDSRNVHSFSHGTSWQSHNSYAPDHVSHLQTQSHESRVSFEDVLMGKLEVIPESLTSLVNSMMDGFGKSFLQTISQVCEENDRVVSTSGSLGEQLIAALEAVEFSVDRDGSIQKPQMMVGSEIMKKILHDSPMLSPELQAKAQTITELKSAQAMEREVARKAKFVKGAD